MPQGTRVPLFLFAAAALVAGANATAWDWRVDEPAPLPMAFRPEFVAPAADGYWAAGASLVRYDAQSRAVARTAFGRAAWLTPLPDGGVVAATEPPPPNGWEPLPAACVLEGFDANARALWRSDPLEGGEGCDVVAAGAEGLLWVSHRTSNGWAPQTWALQTYDARGVPRGRLPLAGRLRDLVADPILPRAYAYSGSQLLTLDDRGQVLASLATEGADRGRLRLTAERQLLLAEASGGGLHLLRLDLDSGARSDRHLPLASPPQAVEALASDAEGRVYLLDRATGFTLRQLGADGSLAWSAAVDPNLTACAGLHDRCELVADAAGVLLPMLRPGVPGGSGSATRSLAIERYAKSGARLGGTALAADRLRGAVALADGGTLVAAVRSSGFPAAPLTLRVAADGSAAPLAPAADGVAPSTAIASRLAPDGTAYLLSDEGWPAEPADAPADPHFTLTAVAPTGTLRWRVRGNGAWNGDTRLVADADRVCLGGVHQDADGSVRLRLACYGAEAGGLRWQRDAAAAGVYADPLVLGLLPDHGVVALLQPGTAGNAPYPLHHQRFAADGTLLHDLDLGSEGWVLFSAAMNGRGDAVLLENGRLTRIDAGGQRRYTALPPAPGAIFPVAVSSVDVADDGAAVLVVYLAKTHVWSVAPDGSTRWAREIDTGYGYPAALRRAGDIVDVAAMHYDPAESGLTTTVARLRLADGSPVWQTALPANLAEVPVPSADPARLLLAGGTDTRVRLRWLDPANGQELAVRSEPCADRGCGFLPPHLGADGVLRLALAGSGRPALVGLQAYPLVAAPVALDQHALGGAWYPRYANGQGVLLDVLMPQRVFFMPWFTYSAEGGNDPAALRWYTVQGDIPAGARQLDLGIYENRGGVFDAPPTTVPQRVGTARVRFDTCDSGNLHYRFDAGHNGGREGDISLSRLLPRTEACVLGDGSSVPPPLPTPPQNGFDARLGGSWFAPATGGQGLQLALQPGGALFGGWFSYDPAGAANDPAQQHWLTLQGSLASARNGIADVAIVQAIGGTFDGLPTGNQYIVGQATLTVLACDHLRLDYRFDDRAVAGPYRARHGRIELTKIGGCPP